MYSRINYTSTTLVNTRLSNPAYTLFKVKDDSSSPVKATKSLQIMAQKLKNSTFDEEIRRKSQNSDNLEDSGISDDCSVSGDSVSSVTADIVLETSTIQKEDDEVFESYPSSVLEEVDYPLNSSWTIYTTRPEIKNWDEKLVKVGEFRTIKQFWAFYQHLKLPSHLKQGCDYMIFRSDIEPCWETPDNFSGGRWMLEVEKTDRNQYLNNIWLETLIAIIGENLSDSREINGVVMQSRRGKDRVSIWVRDATKMDVQKKLGLNYKDTLGEIPFRLRLQKHSDLSGKTSSRKHLLQL